MANYEFKQIGLTINKLPIFLHYKRFSVFQDVYTNAYFNVFKC